MLTGDQPETWSKSFGVTEFAWSKSIRRGDWRLVVYPKTMFADTYPDGFLELYNLADDPWEMTNLAADPVTAAQHADLITSMKADLYDWLVTTTRPVSAIGVEAPADLHRQTKRRFQRDILADGKMDARWLADRRTDNYL